MPIKSKEVVKFGEIQQNKNEKFTTKEKLYFSGKNNQLESFAQEVGYQNQLELVILFIPSSSASKDSVNVLFFFLNNDYQSRGRAVITAEWRQKHPNP